MGISLILMGVSLAMAAKAASEQNKALGAASEAAARQAEGEIQELDRQREFVNQKKAGEKAARVREAERDEAAMLVGMDDRGGGGTSNVARLAAEVGYYEGIDIARLEGNRVRQNESLKSRQVASKNNALNIIEQNKYKAKSNTFKFLSSAAGTGAKAFGGGAAPGSVTGTGSSFTTSSTDSFAMKEFSSSGGDQF